MAASAASSTKRQWRRRCCPCCKWRQPPTFLLLVLVWLTTVWVVCPGGSVQVSALVWPWANGGIAARDAALAHPDNEDEEEPDTAAPVPPNAEPSATVSCDGRQYHPVTRRRQMHQNAALNDEELNHYRRVCRQRLLRNQVALAGKIFPFLDKFANISPTLWIELWRDLDAMTDPEDLLLILLLGWILVPAMAFFVNPLARQVQRKLLQRQDQAAASAWLAPPPPPRPYSEVSIFLFPLLRLIRDAARLSLMIYLVDCIVIVLISLGVELVILDEERLTVVIAKIVYVLWAARLVQSLKTLIIHRIVTLQVKAEEKHLRKAMGSVLQKREMAQQKKRLQQLQQKKKRQSSAQQNDDDDDSDSDSDSDEEESHDNSNDDNEDEDKEHDEMTAALDAQNRANLIEGRCGVLNRLCDAVLYTGVVFFVVDVLQLEMGVALTSVFAFGSISTLIFTLASRDMAGHLVNGLVISVSSNVFEGDFVEFDNGSIVGRVEKLGWTETLIRNRDDKLLVVPNTLLVNKQLCNLSRIKRCSVQQTLHISYDDIAQIPTLVKAIKEEIMAEFHDPEEDDDEDHHPHNTSTTTMAGNNHKNGTSNNNNATTRTTSFSASLEKAAGSGGDGGKGRRRRRRRRRHQVTLVNEHGRPLRVKWTDYGPTSLHIQVDAHFYGIPPLGDAYFETRQRVLEAIRHAFGRVQVPFHVEPV